MNPSLHRRKRWPGALAIASVLWFCAALAQAETFAVIVNKNNPSNQLSASSIAGMYRGETLHWQGGDRIKLVNREISAETRQIFYFHVLNAKPDQVFYRQGTPVPVQSVIERSDDAVVRFVGSIEGAIGYVSLSRLKQIDDGLVKVVLIIEKP
jgi:ABC-type phosphate transport system substrate-binding protein